MGEKRRWRRYLSALTVSAFSLPDYFMGPAANFQKKG